MNHAPPQRVDPPPASAETPLERIATRLLSLSKRGNGAIDHREVREVARLLAFSGTIAPVYGLLALRFHAVYDDRIMVVSSLVAALIQVLVPFVLAGTGRVSWAAQLPVLGGTIQMIGMAVGGGTIAMPALALLPMLPALAILLSGVRQGVVWAAICLGAVTLLGQQEWIGALQPRELDAKTLLAGEMLVQWLGVGMATFIVAFFALQKRDALRELETERARYAELAATDDLTGLPNRARFYESLRDSLARCHRAGSRCAILYVDLDHFKKVNDRSGHHAGDLVLREMAERFRGVVRAGDTLARLGGDEFAVILNEVTSRAGAERLAARINALAREPIIAADETFRIDCSIGIALGPDDAKDPEDLLKIADAAMYAEKRRRPDPV